ncbi:MAG TPA: sugar transferase [Gemmatimonadales bacterium]|nr:sugar transferase [Gemmatimonadales bacterium]
MPPTSTEEISITRARTSVLAGRAAPRTVRHPHPLPEGARRPLNVTVAFLGIVVTAPLMACIAVLLKLTSPGPILYAQTRVGLDRRALGDPTGNGRRFVDHGGKPFTIYKFRTMRVGGDAERQVWARPDDPRVTTLGRVLRKYRLDELPQLFNVLRGDMNVVGPRPEQPRIFADLRLQIEGYGHRQLVRPGITGLAQITNDYDTSVDSVRAKLDLDLRYIRRQSFFEDLRILLLTLPVVALKRGAW